MATLVYSVSRPELPPFRMSDRFRHDIAYFMAVPGEGGVPVMPEGEYWVPLAHTRLWLDAGAFEVVSPLDGERRTEVELSEDQEGWLAWMAENEVQHVRLVSSTV